MTFIGKDGLKSRRQALKAGLAGLGLTATMPMFLKETGLAYGATRAAGHENRIMVVVELNGGNDGLNTVIPYTDDLYYKARPTIAVAKDAVIRVSDEFGLHPSAIGLERIYKDGRMAVINGCGYPNPDRSHFVSMAYWHSGRPNEAEPLGWVGRFLDAAREPGPDPLMVNIASQQSPSLRAKSHAPVVFGDPARFRRDASEAELALFDRLSSTGSSTPNPALQFLQDASNTAARSSETIRKVTADYRTPVNYGFGDLAPQLRIVAALIAADFPARIYYVSLGGFDTHNEQPGRHGQLMGRFGDSMYGFMEDLKRLKRDDDVAVLAFSEFGRRVQENANEGTDHGVAGPMMVFGKAVAGGFHQPHPSLSDLDEGDLRHTTDFRQVYAAMIRDWMGFDDPAAALKGAYEPVKVFA